MGWWSSRRGIEDDVDSERLMPTTALRVRRVASFMSLASAGATPPSRIVKMMRTGETTVSPIPQTNLSK